MHVHFGKKINQSLKFGKIYDLSLNTFGKIYGTWKKMYYLSW